MPSAHTAPASSEKLLDELADAQAEADQLIKQAETLRHDLCVCSIRLMSAMSFIHLLARLQEDEAAKCRRLKRAIAFAHKAANRAYTASVQFLLDEEEVIRKHLGNNSDCLNKGVDTLTRDAALAASLDAQKLLRQNKYLTYTKGERLLPPLLDFRRQYIANKAKIDKSLLDIKKKWQWLYLLVAFIMVGFIAKLLHLKERLIPCMHDAYHWLLAALQS